jgi:hypothetical protein
MINLIQKATLGLVMGATVLTAAAPAAEAQRYRHRHHGGDGGAVVAAGIVGLALGAAISSSDRRYRDPRYDYDRRYYRDHGYYPTDGYYYRENYRSYDGYNRCHVRRVWDPYQGRNVRVRYCR